MSIGRSYRLKRREITNINEIGELATTPFNSALPHLTYKGLN
ncbi:hypothetical protein [Candidatus Jidaibacter acanthamoebae]|nr:hypothetical protein [Candidatus Jidaibacter acanthamoeba]